MLFAGQQILPRPQSQPRNPYPTLTPRNYPSKSYPAVLPWCSAPHVQGMMVTFQRNPAPHRANLPDARDTELPQQVCRVFTKQFAKLYKGNNLQRSGVFAF